jgi:hypothetical protein
MEKFNALKQMVADMEADADKFYDKKNNAAGTRLRKSLQDIKNLCGDLRKDIQDAKNSAS